MALLGALYPLTPSLLYFQLEAFLQAAGPLATLLASDSDVVAVYNRSTGQADITWRQRQPSTPAEQSYATSVHVHVRIDGSHNITRLVTVPLDALVKGQTSLAGFAGFVHGITFVDNTPSQQTIEEWHFVSVTSGAGGWVARMDEFEREVRTGGNRRFKEAWRRYAGAAGVVLHSELKVTGLSEADAMAWEEAQVDADFRAGQSLNPLPGGGKGLQQLVNAGCLAAGSDRDGAIQRWRHNLLIVPDVAPLGLRVPHLLAPWSASDYELLPALWSRRPTPAEVTEVRALALAGVSMQEIAKSKHGLTLATVKAILSSRGSVTGTGCGSE